jgi:hypothetical protein
VAEFPAALGIPGWLKKPRETKPAMDSGAVQQLPRSRSVATAFKDGVCVQATSPSTALSLSCSSATFPLRDARRLRELTFSDAKQETKKPRLDWQIGLLKKRGSQGRWPEKRLAPARV